MNQAIHNVDLLQWMMGPVDARSAASPRRWLTSASRSRTPPWPCLRFASGGAGRDPGDDERPTRACPRRSRVHGDRGTVVIEQDDVLRWDFDAETPDDDAIRRASRRRSARSGGSSNPAAISHQGHARQLPDFVEAIRGGRKPLVDGREGRKAVAIIEAIYQSAATGRAVALGSVLPVRGRAAAASARW